MPTQLLTGVHTSGVTEVKRGVGFSAGYYCLYGNFSPNVATGTVDWVGSTGGEYVQNVALSGAFALAFCPASTAGPVKAVVQIRLSNGSLVDASFYVIFD